MKLYNPNKELVAALKLNPIWVQSCNSDTCSHASHDAGYEYCIIDAEEIESVDIWNRSHQWEYSETLYRSKGVEFSVYSSSYAGTFDKSRLGREYFDLAMAQATEDEEQRKEKAEERHQEEIEAQEERRKDWETMERSPEFKICRKALAQGHNPCKVLRNLGYKNVSYSDGVMYPGKGTVIILNPKTDSCCSISFEK